MTVSHSCLHQTEFEVSNRPVNLMEWKECDAMAIILTATCLLHAMGLCHTVRVWGKCRSPLQFKIHCILIIRSSSWTLNFFYNTYLVASSIRGYVPGKMWTGGWKLLKLPAKNRDNFEDLKRVVVTNVNVTSTDLLVTWIFFFFYS